MNERGKIKNPKRKQQINDFSGLIYGKITPTDIDGLIEYKNKAYIFIEVKYNDALLPYGQKLALERLVKDTATNGKRSIAIIAQHDVSNTNESIFVSECKVRATFLDERNQWKIINQNISVKQCIDAFLNAINALTNQKYAKTS